MEHCEGDRGHRRSVEEKGSEVSLGNFSRERAEERTLRKTTQAKCRHGKENSVAVLIGRSGQPERAQRCWSWRGA